MKDDSDNVGSCSVKTVNTVNGDCYVYGTKDANCTYICCRFRETEEYECETGRKSLCVGTYNIGTSEECEQVPDYGKCQAYYKVCSKPEIQTKLSDSYCFEKVEN